MARGSCSSPSRSRTCARSGRDRAARVPNGNGAREEPAINAVVSSQGERVLPHLTALERSALAVAYARKVVRMVDAVPAEVAYVVERQP